ncbi:hypothetical protein R3P38DRAFT_2797329 [Favolaschia claudopus]|uniref:Uncharacterized protein n=1 Tax=Favolaschia claudopus TaxID=2862362 RepID=A0AAW0A3R5_9AGAR
MKIRAKSVLKASVCTVTECGWISRVPRYSTFGVMATRAEVRPSLCQRIKLAIPSALCMDTQPAAAVLDETKKACKDEAILASVKMSSVALADDEDQSDEDMPALVPDDGPENPASAVEGGQYRYLRTANMATIGPLVNLGGFSYRTAVSRRQPDAAARSRCRKSPLYVLQADWYRGERLACVGGPSPILQYFPLSDTPTSRSANHVQAKLTIRRAQSIGAGNVPQTEIRSRPGAPLLQYFPLSDYTDITICKSCTGETYHPKGPKYRRGATCSRPRSGLGVSFARSTSKRWEDTSLPSGNLREYSSEDQENLPDLRMDGFPLLFLEETDGIAVGLGDRCDLMVMEFASVETLLRFNLLPWKGFWPGGAQQEIGQGGMKREGFVGSRGPPSTRAVSLEPGKRHIRYTSRFRRSKKNLPPSDGWFSHWGRKKRTESPLDVSLEQRYTSPYSPETPPMLENHYFSSPYPVREAQLEPIETEPAVLKLSEITDRHRREHIDAMCRRRRRERIDEKARQFRMDLARRPKDYASLPLRKRPIRIVKRRSAGRVNAPKFGGVEVDEAGNIQG